MRPFTVSILLCFIHLSLSAQQVVSYTNGLVFDGTSFSNKSFWTVDNKITFKEPQIKGTTFDVEGRYVVPSYGDAVAMGYSDFNDPEYYLKQYQQEGIQFLVALGHSAAFEEKAKAVISPNTAEVRFANGVITSVGGNPSPMWDELVQKRKLNTNLNNAKGPTGAGDNYWMVYDKDAVKLEFPKILLQKPEMICAYLPDASAATKLSSKMDEKTLKAIAKATKKAKLKLVLITKTKADFLMAMSLKPHLIVGIPSLDGLSDKEISTLKKSKAYVAPCLFASMRNLAMDPSTLTAAGVNQAQIIERQSKLFKALLAAKIPLVLGSGDPSRTTMPEVNHWVQMGVANQLELLAILCENTPKCIYPDRSVGKIAEGYEANFLILTGNPTDNIQKARLIHKSVKNGKVLDEVLFKQ
jgi:hypothetical protein